MNNLLPVLGLATIGSIAGLAGGLAILYKKTWAKTISVHAIPFAAGVLLAVSFLDVLPEAIEESGSEDVFKIVLAVMVIAFFLEQFFLHVHHHEKSGRGLVKTALPLVVVGDSIHNFIDGVAIAAAFLVEPALGVLVAFATFLHEIPHEMGDFGLMLAAGWKRTKIIVVNVFSALATYAGSIAVLATPSFSEQNLGSLLAVAGGIFLYIGASDLLPEAHQERSDSPWHQAILLLLGVLVIWLVGKILPSLGF